MYALVAHRVKGAAANVGAPALRDVAAAFEKKARVQSLDGAAELLQLLDTQWHRFVEATGEFVGPPTGP